MNLKVLKQDNVIHICMKRLGRLELANLIDEIDSRQEAKTNE